jgi:hypothetical protein
MLNMTAVKIRIPVLSEGTARLCFAGNNYQAVSLRTFQYHDVTIQWHCEFTENAQNAQHIFKGKRVKVHHTAAGTCLKYASCQ